MRHPPFSLSPPSPRSSKWIVSVEPGKERIARGVFHAHELPFIKKGGILVLQIPSELGRSFVVNLREELWDKDCLVRFNEGHEK